jgi:diphthamide synthase subunit DPH2
MSKAELKDGTVVVQIASCAGTKQAAEQVESILRSRGIEPVLHGSRAYAMCVPEGRAEQARQLLKSDPQKERFRSCFGLMCGV